MVTQGTIRRRVNRGVALLNRIKPGWFNHISLTYLNLSQPSNCVLGQLFNDYTNGIRSVGLPVLYNDKGTDLEAKRGFHADVKSLDSGEGSDYYTKLNATWKRAIKELQATAA